MIRMDVRGVWNRTAPWKRRIAATLTATLIAVVCYLARDTTGAGPAAAQAPAEAAVAASPQAAPATAAGQPAPAHDVAAVVNGIRITRAELAEQCLQKFGADVLESLINRTLIADYSAAKGIQVTRQQVDEEIDRMAQRFNVSRDEWLKMLEKERNISATQYANDIIWPTIALRMVAGTLVQPTEAEVRDAYETQFGPAVQCRLIALDTEPKAREVLALATAKPDEFGNLAKQYSADVNSASAKGLIQPIRKHMGDLQLEQMAFALKPGEVSQIVPVGQQFVILKCESHIPARAVPLAQVQKLLEDAIRDKKLRMASSQVFELIKRESPVENVFADQARRAQEPAVAARINGRVLSTQTLAEECIARHGTAVLEHMIGRLLLTQALQTAQVAVTQADLDVEISEAALRMGMTMRDANNNEVANVDAWLKQVVEVQRIPYDEYVADTVWPSAALKKLVASHVQVTDEDLQKGYEANYGPRAKCRAIVVTQMRRAQEVWQMARDNPTIENFGLLAEQYSVDSVSRTLRGEVPPIQRHGGQPELEREAFALQAGELSGIIEVGDTFVILYCEGQTTPRNLPFEEVRDLIKQDVFEKKLASAMARQYDHIHQTAKIDNFVTGTVQSPTLGRDVGKAAADRGAVPAGFTAPAQP